MSFSVFPVLDHGYVFKVEHYGSDERIVEAARMSTDAGFVSWEPYEKHPDGDMGLLRYLYDHRHETPFEMSGMIIEVQAPIFIFREWHRHRTQSYNEMSARYTPLPDVNYVPTVERLMLNAGGTNKQAGTVKGATALTTDMAIAFQDELITSYKKFDLHYQWALDGGVPKELARCAMPVGRYSRMRANANLRNWLAFLTLRDDVNAQWEIRQYAKIVDGIIQQLFPRTHSCYVARRTRWEEFVAWSKEKKLAEGAAAPEASAQAARAEALREAEEACRRVMNEAEDCWGRAGASDCVGAIRALGRDETNVPPKTESEGGI